MQKLFISLVFALFASTNLFSQTTSFPEFPKPVINKPITQPKITEAERLIRSFEFKIEKFQSFDYELYLRNFRNYKMHVIRHTT